MKTKSANTIAYFFTGVFEEDVINDTFSGNGNFTQNDADSFNYTYCFILWLKKQQKQKS
ncbi:MAG: hypothetical protein V4717_21030 [Bacteroidota bacterium]